MLVFDLWVFMSVGKNSSKKLYTDANTEIEGDGVLDAFIAGGLAELVDDSVAGLLGHLKDVGHLFIVDCSLVEVLVVDLLHRLGGHLERERCVGMWVCEDSCGRVCVSLM